MPTTRRASQALGSPTRTYVASLLFEFVKRAIGVGLASVLYYVIERPFLALKSRWEPQRQGTRGTLSPGPDPALQPTAH